MASRGVRESLRLLARSPALLAALAPPAAAAAAPAGQAATSLQVEVAALRRWLHTRGTPSLWQQHLRQQPAAWLRQQGAGGSAADVQRACGRRWMTDRPRGRRELYEDINKRVTDQGWYIVSGGGGGGDGGGAAAGMLAGPAGCGMCDAPHGRCWPLPTGPCHAPPALQLATAVAMVGVTYAAVPLYRMFCQATGYGGTVIEGKAVEDKIRRWEENPDEAVAAAAAKRELTVFFNSDVAGAGAVVGSVLGRGGQRVGSRREGPQARAVRHPHIPCLPRPPAQMACPGCSSPRSAA